MIQLEKVSKRFGEALVLDAVNLEVQQGETLAIVGPSGAGKSVMLKHMVRLLTPDQGRVLVENQEMSSLEGRDLERLREKFGMLFQGGALLQWLTVGENVALPLREKSNLSETQIVARVRQKLEMVGLQDEYDKWPTDLSGGMRKRAGLARAIVENPRIILYDEPTSGLDPVSSRLIDDLINDLRRRTGVTSVVVTHDLHSALMIGDRIAMLYEGSIVETATPEKFIASENEIVRQFLDAQYITRRGEWEKETP